jgi:hypothetical protein
VKNSAYNEKRHRKKPGAISDYEKCVKLAAILTKLEKKNHQKWEGWMANTADSHVSHV